MGPGDLKLHARLNHPDATGSGRPREPVRWRWALSVLLALVAAVPVLTPTRAAVVPWMSLEQITSGSDVIVVGSVEDLEAVWSADGRIIITRVKVSVERAIKGGPRRSLVLETPGGRVGDQFMVASGAPVFARGERVVLFLEAGRVRAGGRSDEAAPPFSVVGWNQGRMRIRRDPSSGRELVFDRTGDTIYMGPDGRPVEPRPRAKGPREIGRFLDEVRKIIDTAGGDEP